MDAGKRTAGPDSRALIFCFTLGVLIVHAVPALPPAPWLLLGLVPALVPWRFRPHLLCFALGVVLTAARGLVWLDTRWPESRHGEEITIEGRVASLPELTLQAPRLPRDSEVGKTWRFVFAPADEALPRLRVSWYRSEVEIKGGDCWRLKLRVRTPRGSHNPGSFDYEGWLFRQDIGALASVRNGEPCEAPSGYAVLRWRQSLVTRLNDWLPDHPAQGLMAALLVGDQSGIRDAQWDVFRLTGTSHLVAISGLNIAVAAGFAFFLCRWLWTLWPRLCLWLPAQKAGMLASAFAAVGYALMAGFEPPVVRAMLMALVILAAAWLHRLSQPSRVLAIAWLLILLADPFAVLSPGLWLSFGAVAAIFYFSMNRVLSPGVLFGVVALQLLLSVVLAPLSLYFFKGVSAASPLVNLLAVPIFSLLTPVLLAALILALAVPTLGVPLLRLCAGFLDGLQDVLAWCAAHADTLWWAAGPPAAALALALLGSVLLFAPRGLPLRPLGFVCFLPLLFPPRLAPTLEVTALDVGQGLSVVVRTAQHALVYDAGPAFGEGFDAGESVVAPFLLTQGLGRIDTLLGSHGDNDHAGGIPSVRRLLRIDREIGTEGGETCRAGERWEWDGVRFEFLHPDGGNWSDNDSSCVLRVEGPFSALLAGDIEKAAEARLLRDAPSRLRADLLIAPHHGSRTSSTQGFVDAVRPQIVIYGAAWRSHFGHPRPEVVARYAAHGAAQYVTGASGAVAVTAGEAGWAISESRRENLRFWQARAGP